MMMNIFEKIVRYFKSLLGYDNIHQETPKEAVSKSTEHFEEVHEPHIETPKEFDSKSIDYNIFLYKDKLKCINVVFDQKIINGKHYIYRCNYVLNGEEVNYTDEQYKMLAKDIYRYPQKHHYRNFLILKDYAKKQFFQEYSNAHRNGVYIHDGILISDYEYCIIYEKNGKAFLDASLRGGHFEMEILYPLSQKQRCYSLHYLNLLARQIREDWQSYKNMDTKNITEDTQTISQDEPINEIIIYNPVPEFGELSDVEWRICVHDSEFCKEIECSE